MLASYVHDSVDFLLTVAYAASYPNPNYTLYLLHCQSACYKCEWEGCKTPFYNGENFIWQNGVMMQLSTAFRWLKSERLSDFFDFYDMYTLFLYLYMYIIHVIMYFTYPNILTYPIKNFEAKTKGFG